MFLHSETEAGVKNPWRLSSSSEPVPLCLEAIPSNNLISSWSQLGYRLDEARTPLFLHILAWTQYFQEKQLSYLNWVVVAVAAETVAESAKQTVTDLHVGQYSLLCSEPLGGSGSVVALSSVAVSIAEIGRLAIADKKGNG